MPAPSYQDSKEKLIDDMRATAGAGSRQFDIAQAILDVKGQEELASHTGNLVRATWALAFATIGLLISTVALIIVSLGSR